MDFIVRTGFESIKHPQTTINVNRINRLVLSQHHVKNVEELLLFQANHL